jgi:hypothetical protein
MATVEWGRDDGRNGFCCTHRNRLGGPHVVVWDVELGKKSECSFLAETLYHEIG